MDDEKNQDEKYHQMFQSIEKLVRLGQDHGELPCPEEGCGGTIAWRSGPRVDGRGIRYTGGCNRCTIGFG
jgi:hypothetical protein